MTLFIVGGNRKHEDEPLKSLILHLKKINLNFVLITDKIHLYKECKNFKDLKEFLKKYKIKYYLFNNINLEYIRLNNLIKEKNSYLLALNSIWIFKKEIINLFKNRIFNLHIGKLPNQKGAGGASWQILSQDKFSAATIHEISNKIDDGKILIEKKFSIKKTTSLIEYYKSVNVVENKILKQFVHKISKKKKLKFLRINKKNSIYMPRLETNTHGFIDWSWGGNDILNFIRAFDDPYTGASTFYNNRLVHIKKAKIIDKNKIFHPFQSGIIIRATDQYICVAICKGILKLSELTNIRGKKIVLKDIKLGERLHTPIKFLENAKQKRALHTGQGIKINNAKK